MAEGQTLVERLMTRLQGALTDVDLALCLIEDATAACNAYLNRDQLPASCESAMLRMAAALFNRLGMEGESSHSEGGLSASVEGMPSEIKAMLRPYRLCRTGA